MPSGKRIDALYCSNACGNRVRGNRWDKANPLKVQANRACQNNRASSRILSRIKFRAKAIGVPFDLDIADIVIPPVCPVLGIPIVDQARDGRQGYNVKSASVDRILGDLGYVKGNIRVISNRANMLKSDATVEELLAVVAYIKEATGWVAA